VDVVTFTLPVASADTAKYLRELEANAPKTTQRDIRDALIHAAKELEAWKNLGEDTARQLEEAANARISQMATTSAVDEVQRGVKRTMLDLAARFKELA
jgi:hypothetical protein